MPADQTSRIRLGDGSVIRSKERLEPGIEVTGLVAGESDLKLFDSVVLVDRDEDGFHSVLRNGNSFPSAGVPEGDVRGRGFWVLYSLRSLSGIVIRI